MHNYIKITLFIFVIFCVIYIATEKPELIQDVRKIRPFLVEFKEVIEHFAYVVEDAHNRNDYGQIALGVNDFSNFLKNNADKLKIIFAVCMALFVVVGNIFVECINYIHRHKLILFLFALFVFASVDVAQIPGYVHQFLAIKI